MQVVHYEEAEQWFLLEEDRQFFLDVYYSEGIADIPRFFALTAQETDAYQQEGLPFLSQLAARAQDAARGEFKPRNLPRAWHDKSHAAIIAWRTANGTLIQIPLAVPIESLC